MQRKIRVLVGKPGLDGHDRGAKVVAAALRDAGMEVIYTGLHQSPEQVVEAAVQEDVDVVALSILSGAHMTLFPEVRELMKSRGIGDRLLTGGGIIPAEDMETLARAGVGRLFGPGSSTQDIARYIHEWCGAKYGADDIAPLREPVDLSAETTWSDAETAHLRKPAPARARPVEKKAAPVARAAKKPAAKKASRKVAARSASRPKSKPAARRKPAVKRATSKRRTSKRSSSRRS
jgi:methylmalonyl-CoA mutase C-terminal domain/subunit